MTYSDWCTILVIVRPNYVLFRSTYYCHKKIKDHLVENLKDVEIIEHDMNILMPLKGDDAEFMILL